MLALTELDGGRCHHNGHALRVEADAFY
ncbi:MAG: hypothetical protein RIS10_1518, partial [Pseudomonadota bacterium]